MDFRGTPWSLFMKIKTGFSGLGRMRGYAV
jgi:hypothetical protein